jgi:hypothetical protein
MAKALDPPLAFRTAWKVCHANSIKLRLITRFAQQKCRISVDNQPIYESRL